MLFCVPDNGTGLQDMRFCDIIRDTVKAEFNYWRMLFEEEQHLGDCIVNERFANTSRNPLVF